jgi:superfamily II DNA or RNA helicase
MEKIIKQMTSNENKTKEQKKALNSWAAAGFRGSIIAGTGFGKSRCALLACDYILNRMDSPKIILLVPTLQLQDQFVDEFHKWNLEHCLDHVEIMCYQSAYKLKNEKYDLVICDEIHLGLSEEYRKFFINNTTDKILCMTATLPEEEEYRIILDKLAPTVYTITLDQCVALGIVSPYEIYCMPIILTDQEREDYKTINNNFVRCKYALGQYDAFNQAKAIIGNKNSDPEDRAVAAQFYKAIRERKAIVDFAHNKIAKFQHLIQTNPDKKVLVFSGANNFTDQLCESVKPLAVSYHSGKTKKQRESSLNSFRDDKINILCSTKALNQGLDIPNANLGIICGITSKSLSMIQRVGRLIRFEEGKIGKVIILYVKDSQEEKWLKNSVKTLNNIKWL